MKLSVVLSLLLCTHAVAGQPDGPFLVWADLSGQPNSRQTQMLHEYNQSEPNDEFCGDAAVNRRLYLYKRPQGFTDDLLSDALIKNSRAAHKRLRDLIVNVRDKFTQDGVDGVVVYTETGGPKLISMDAHGRQKVAKLRNPADLAEFSKSFCAIYPTTFRD